MSADMNAYPVVACDACGATATGGGIEGAAAAWNRRVTPPALPPSMDEQDVARELNSPHADLPSSEVEHAIQDLELAESHGVSSPYVSAAKVRLARIVAREQAERDALRAKIATTIAWLETNQVWNKGRLDAVKKGT